MATLIDPIPSNVRAPDDFHTFRSVKSGSGLDPLPMRVLLIGMKSAAGTATVETPVQVFDLSDAITKCGVGSELHLMAAKAFEQGRLNQASGRPGAGTPEVWICPIAALSGGGAAAAAQTLTVTASSAQAGTLVVRIAGRTIYVGVSALDAQNTIATALKNAIAAAAADLPGTAAVSTNVVTFTAPTTGTNGNDVAFEVVSAPSGVAVASAQSVAGVGTIDITNALNAAVDKNYDAVVPSIHSSAAISDLGDHLTAMWGYAQKMFRWGVVGDRASLSTAQGYATAADSERILIATYEQCPNLPSEIATAFAVAVFGISQPNANYDNVELALYPPPATYVYTGAEVESALAGGVTPLRPTPSASRSEIVRGITAKLTEGGAPFDALLDIGTIRTLAYRAQQYHLAYRARFRQEIIDGAVNDPEATLLKRVRDMCVGLDREMAAQTPPILRDVEATVPEIRIAESSVVAGRLVVKAPCRPAGALHQVSFDHINYYL